MSEGHRILLVEDSETQAMKLRLHLEEEGWEVSCAASGEEALELLNRTIPDLILVDYYLPGIRGDELCRVLRRNVDTRGIPVLMLTVDENEAAETRGLESGADDYVSKSADFDLLLLRIRALLRKSQTQAVLGAAEVFRRAHVLAIDDSPTYLQYLVEELATEGYRVESATSALEGLERLSAGRVDCVLVDLIMPDIDGVEVCRRINEMRRSMDNPIVVMMLTARENKEDMTRGLEAGADDFVGKSSDMAVLKARIRALLRRKFFQEENQRIAQELRERALEAVRARAEKEAAEARATLAEELAQTNRELEETNRKLRETQMHLVHTEKMASLGQLVAGIAHEINNPLAFVLNHLFIVERDLARLESDGSSLPASSRGRLEKIHFKLVEMREGLERVKDLVLNLRTFSRLDEGEFKTIDVPQSIESVLLFLNHKMGDAIRVEKRYGPRRQAACYAGQLNQVLMNLLANAIEAIEGEGTVTISTREERDAFVISICDSGKGIPEAIRHRVFEPFFTTKPLGQGVGLGLSISYGIVQQHRGTIEVRSEEGKGSEFTVKIPLDLEG